MKLFKKERMNGCLRLVKVKVKVCPGLAQNASKTYVESSKLSEQYVG